MDIEERRNKEHRAVYEATETAWNTAIKAYQLSSRAGGDDIVTDALHEAMGLIGKAAAQASRAVAFIERLEQAKLSGEREGE
jgi:hypothetical protein